MSDNPIDKPTRWLERFLDWMGFSLTWILPAIGSLLVIWLLFHFLMGAQSRASDEIFHLSNEMLVAEALEQGRSPFGLLPVNLGVPGFRTYQALHAIVGGTLQYLLKLPPPFVHNWLIILLFAATPWTYRKFYLELGLHPIAAGAGGLLCIASVGGFTNSFEAYFRLAVIAQAGASVLLPLALTMLLRILDQGRGTVLLGVLMGLAALSHAMFAAYAIFGAFIIVLVQLPTRLSTWLKLGAAAVLAVTLTAGWLLPFLHNNTYTRPVHDSVANPHHNYYFTVLSPNELTRFLYTGRLFDGDKRDGSADDKLEANLNHEATIEARFPFLTVLFLLGLLLAIIGARNRANRILIAGFSLGLLFLLGTDDITLFSRLPLFNNLEYFRMTYFVELFAFGLGGLTVYKSSSLLVGFILRYLKTKHILRTLSKVACACISIFVLFTYWSSVSRVVTPYLNQWDTKLFDPYISILNKAGPPDPHKRVAIFFDRSSSFRKALNHGVEVYGNYRTSCQHWACAVSATNAKACGKITHWYRYTRLARLAGIRYGVTEFTKVKHLIPKKDKKTEYKLLKRHSRLAILEDKRASMLHDIAGPRVLVVSKPAQWYFLVNTWLNKWSNKIGQSKVPWLLNAPAEALQNNKLISTVDAVMYLDDSNLEQDISALKSIAKSGKKLALAMPIDGVNARIFKQSDRSWREALGLLSVKRANSGAKIKRLDRGKNIERLSFSVDTKEPALLVFSMQHFENWRARIDGKPVITMATGPDLVSVIAPKGKHVIDFAFEATPIDNWSMAASGLGWCGVFCFSILLGIRRLRKRFKH